ncbi:MAG: DNA topoisomerase IB [Bacteroidota bacterium]
MFTEKGHSAQNEHDTDTTNTPEAGNKQADEALQPALKKSGIEAVHDCEPGIKRKRAGKGFYYINPDGSKLTDTEMLAHIKTLRIPPAYADVWICNNTNGHLLATGIDAKKRKQYIYHPEFTAKNNKSKFRRLRKFGMALPALRKKLSQDLKAAEWTLQKTTALVVKLIDEFQIRVGNRAYEKLNGSYGITTLRKKHLRRDGDNLSFEFKAKSGKMWKVPVNNKELASQLSDISTVPGLQLFKFTGADGKQHGLSSGHVNSYIREATGSKFSAKDFRTWKASVLAIEKAPEAEQLSEGKRLPQKINALLRLVAAEMGNTMSVCRKYYIHPAVLSAFEKGKLAKCLQKVSGERLRFFRKAELAAMELMK